MEVCNKALMLTEVYYSHVPQVTQIILQCEQTYSSLPVMCFSEYYITLQVNNYLPVELSKLQEKKRIKVNSTLENVINCVHFQYLSVLNFPHIV